jgi:hypothetical protein
MLELELEVKIEIAIGFSLLMYVKIFAELS